MPTPYKPTMINLPTGLEMLVGEDTHEGECPTCRQGLLLRPVRLSKKLIPALILWNERPHASTVTAEDIKARFGTVAYTVYSRLKYWGFMVQDGDAWTLTEQGRLFMAGAIEVPEVLWVYNDHARLVPDAMLGRYVTMSTLVPGFSPTRREAAAASIPLDATGQERMDV